MKPRAAIDEVVAKLPSPDKLKGGGDYKAKPKKEPDSNVGEESAFNELVDALGIKPKDRERAMAALSDYIRICASNDEG